MILQDCDFLYSASKPGINLRKIVGWKWKFSRNLMFFFPSYVAGKKKATKCSTASLQCCRCSFVGWLVSFSIWFQLKELPKNLRMGLRKWNGCSPYLIWGGGKESNWSGHHVMWGIIPQEYLLKYGKWNFLVLPILSKINWLSGAWLMSNPGNDKTVLRTMLSQFCTKQFCAVWDPVRHGDKQKMENNI